MTQPNTPTSAVANVFSAAGEPLTRHVVPLPALRASETLVRITCCTICGSDLHTFSGTRTAPVPSVLGHEIIGIVEGLSEPGPRTISGEALRIGDRITWSVAVSCGNCRRCTTGIPQKCDSLFKYGHELFSPHAELSGGLAEYCVLKSGTAIVKLPAQLSDNVACPANCATATVAAAVRHVAPMRGKRVLIVGAGMLGLTTGAFADAAGADEICVCDVNPSRLSRAMDFGATQVSSTIVQGDFDCVFEMSGQPRAVEAAIQAAGIGGQIVLVGSVSPSRSVSVDPERIVRRLLSIQGVHNYRPDDLVQAVQFLQQHEQTYPFDELIEKTFPLSAVNEAFRFAVEHRPIRVAVVP